jgi:hypothetical protein
MPSPPKPWPVSVFERERAHLTTFVRTTLLPLVENVGCRRITVRAPVKCGKREIVEYIAMRDAVEQPVRVHAFISGWHRKADADQRVELASQNLKVFSIKGAKDVAEYLEWRNKQLANNKEIVNHFDECDHASGFKQMLSKIWREVRNHDRITNILYSATPEEVLFSGEVEDEEYNAMVNEMIDEGEHVEYEPPEGYCGPARFLNPGQNMPSLVQEATPFFYKTADGVYRLTPQGLKIVADLRTAMATAPARNIIVLRLSYSDLGGKQADIKKNKAIYQFLTNFDAFPELADFLVVVDKGDDMGIKNHKITPEKIQWSTENYWRRQAIGVPMLFVIDQTSSRSTEWACHNRVFAHHDFRNIIQYSTVSQAQERVNHYESRYGGFQPIRVYGSVRTFKLSAGLIDYATFLKNEWEKKKIDVRVGGPEPKYRVRSTAEGNALHPRCPEAGLPEADANRLLQDLGCAADISLSNRVAGKLRPVYTFAATHHEVDKDTWDEFWPRYAAANGLLPPDGRRDLTRNPFRTAEPYRLPAPDGRWQGYHRGWRVLDFDRDIVGDEGWGATDRHRIKVCYKDGTLGVAIAVCTGRQMMNSLRAYKSMFGPQPGAQ